MEQTRISTIATRIGSKAKTQKGIVSALKEYKKRNPRRMILTEQPVRMSKYRYTEEQKSRKADPEAKAAREGHNRKQYLASLTRRENALLKIIPGLDGMITAIAQRYDRNHELMKISRLRAIVTGKKHPAKMVDTARAIKIMSFNSTLAEKHGFKCRKTGKDWSVIASLEPSEIRHIDGETEWKNGKPKSYTRATNDNYIRSFAVIIDPQKVEGIFHETRYNLNLPAGYAWDKDQDALKAVSVTAPENDYHPNVDDIFKGSDYIVNQLRENQAKRERQAAIAAAEKAELEGIYICIKDSLRAGNCFAGSTGFAARHGLSVARHYSAFEILKIAESNRDNLSRAKLAISAAIEQHQKEMERGYTLIEDHRISA
jgi:hypothetical protein